MKRKIDAEKRLENQFEKFSSTIKDAVDNLQSTKNEPWSIKIVDSDDHKKRMDTIMKTIEKINDKLKDA
ncbi:MAG: hypothetical protein ACTH7M_04765 [Streptococcus thermophilus]